jgi:hypothetical protein
MLEKNALIHYNEWGPFFMIFSVLSSIPGILCTSGTHGNLLFSSHPQSPVEFNPSIPHPVRYINFFVL